MQSQSEIDSLLDALGNDDDWADVSFSDIPPEPTSGNNSIVESRNLSSFSASSSSPNTTCRPA